jgi:hypothetical protein
LEKKNKVVIKNFFKNGKPKIENVKLFSAKNDFLSKKSSADWGHVRFFFLKNLFHHYYSQSFFFHNARKQLLSIIDQDSQVFIFIFIL